MGVRFKSGGTFYNHFMYLAPTIAPENLPGEVRPVEWAMLQIADRLGFGNDYNPTLYPNVKGAWNPSAWESAVVAAHKTTYEAWAALDAIKPLSPPTWDNFLKNPVFYLDAPDNPSYTAATVGLNPFNALANNMKATDKIEIYSAFLEDKAKVANTLFSGGSCLGKVGDAVTGYPTWNYGMYGSYYDNRTKNYPLVLLTLESGFRSHSAHYNNPLLKDDCYRHGLWLSAADAAARGINDGDLVRAFNNVGEAVLEAYVTNKLIPGVAALGHGGWYAPNSTKTALNPDGIDRGGAPNILLEDAQPDKMTIGPSLDKGVIQVEKF
jgi:anaerobic dimethyl sulfoxide reductase subunit A